MEDQGSEGKKQSEVNSQLDRQKGCIADLKKMINVLQGRLQSVLKPEKPSIPDEAKKTPGPLIVPLADEIQANNKSIEISVSQIQGITARLGI